MPLKITSNALDAITTLHAANTAPTNPLIHETLAEIESKIKETGDEALCFFTQKYDKASLTPDQLLVSREEINAAYKIINKKTIDALKKAKENIETFHRFQIPKNWTHSPEPGITYGNRFSPIEIAGLYVPGGRAPYPSTVLMDAIPAKIAGVKTLVMTTPPQADGSIPPQILVAADLCGVTHIVKAGGAQAIFALANGTTRIPKVDKIVGPGNMYVDLAKQKVYGQVDIDKPAGPSDVLVYIKDAKYAPYAAAELLAQLEHDPKALACAISTEKKILDAINEAIEAQLPTLSRKDIISEAMKNSCLILATSESESMNIINQIAPEHLVLLCDEGQDLLPQIKHAGSIFCGPYTPVTLGDYVAGPNHVLPTSGASRFASPLGVMDFMKYSSFLDYSKDALHAIKDTTETLTKLEGFDAHFNAIKQRFNA